MGSEAQETPYALSTEKDLAATLAASMIEANTMAAALYQIIGTGQVCVSPATIKGEDYPTTLLVYPLPDAHAVGEILPLGNKIPDHCIKLRFVSASGVRVVMDALKVIEAGLMGGKDAAQAEIERVKSATLPPPASKEQKAP